MDRGVLLVVYTKVYARAAIIHPYQCLPAHLDASTRFLITFLLEWLRAGEAVTHNFVAFAANFPLFQQDVRRHEHRYPPREIT